MSRRVSAVIASLFALTLLAPAAVAQPLNPKPQPKTHLGGKSSAILQLHTVTQVNPGDTDVAMGTYDGAAFVPFVIPRGSVFVMTDFWVFSPGPPGGLYSGYICDSPPCDPNVVAGFGFDTTITGDYEPHYHVGAGIVYRSTPTVTSRATSASRLSVSVRGYLAKDR